MKIDDSELDKLKKLKLVPGMPAEVLVPIAKRTALQLFPDKEETFDTVYGPRFRRILVEKYQLL